MNSNKYNKKMLLKHTAYPNFKGVVEHLGKYTYLLSSRELDEKMDTTPMPMPKPVAIFCFTGRYVLDCILSRHRHFLESLLTMTPRFPESCLFYDRTVEKQERG